jgi:hypothetical protein
VIVAAHQHFWDHAMMPPIQSRSSTCPNIESVSGSAARGLYQQRLRDARFDEQRRELGRPDAVLVRHPGHGLGADSRAAARAVGAAATTWLPPSPPRRAGSALDPPRPRAREPFAARGGPPRRNACFAPRWRTAFGRGTRKWNSARCSVLSSTKTVIRRIAPARQQPRPGKRHERAPPQGELGPQPNFGGIRVRGRDADIRQGPGGSTERRKTARDPSIPPRSVSEVM